MEGYSRSRQDFIRKLAEKYYLIPNQLGMEEIEELGCLGTGEQATDYVLCNGDSDLLPTLYKKDEIRYTYNQYKNKWSMVSCTIFAAIGMLSDLINYEFSYDQIKEVDELSYTRGRFKGKGRWVQSAVKLVADRYNDSELSKTYGKVAYYRISKYDDEIIEDVIDKLYTIDGNVGLNSQYNADKKDGMLDGTDFGNATNGHSIDVVKKEGQRSVKDSGSVSYYGVKNKLSQITNFGEYFYVYTLVKEDNLERIKKLNKIRALILNGIPINSDLWKESGSDYHKNKLHDMNDFYRDWLSYIDNELKTLM